MLARFSRPGRALSLAITTASAAAGYAYYSMTDKVVNNQSPIKTFTGDNQWIDLPIKKIESLSSDSRRFTFELPSEDHVTGLITASALLAKYVTPKGSNVIRPYTPVSDNEDRGEFQLVVKHYNGGKMTSHLFDLKENDKVSFKGPIVKWPWKANSFENVVLLGAGTGITPLYQLLHHIVKNPEDKTKIHLFYGNKSPQDILMKDELDKLHARFPDRFKVTYFVDTPSASYDGEKGFISKEHLQKLAPGPKSNTQVFICGPPPFMDAYSGQKVSPTDQGELKGLLAELGWKKDQVFKF